MKTDVLIVGGGLSGLALADHLNRAGVDFHLIEARDRLGGRILTEQSGQGYFDLGPAWFWPGQPRIDALIDRFGLTRFEQHHAGILTFEDERGAVQRGRGHASMQGSWRLEGGLQSVVQALAATLPASKIRLRAQLVDLAAHDAEVTGTLDDGTQIVARQVVLAIPPRIAAQDIKFSPALPEAAQAALSHVPTWMAGQAKAVAIYDRPFWREEGLSGDAMSRFGPMVQIHDASPADASSGAIFGFIGVPPAARQDTSALRAQVLDQLERLFGPKAGTPAQLLIQDWAFDPLTATLDDQKPLFAHPQYGMPRALSDLMDGRLMLAGTEMGQQFGGFIEGALEAAEDVRNRLQAFYEMKPAA